MMKLLSCIIMMLSVLPGSGAFCAPASSNSLKDIGCAMGLAICEPTTRTEKKNGHLADYSASMLMGFWKGDNEDESKNETSIHYWMIQRTEEGTFSQTYLVADHDQQSYQYSRDYGKWSLDGEQYIETTKDEETLYHIASIDENRFVFDSESEYTPEGPFIYEERLLPTDSAFPDADIKAMIAGYWKGMTEEENAEYHWLIQRKADGTFVQQYLDILHDQQTYSRLKEHGHWSIKGDNYIEQPDSNDTEYYRLVYLGPEQLQIEFQEEGEEGNEAYIEEDRTDEQFTLPSPPEGYTEVAPD